MVEPPSAFSPTYVVMTIFEGSIISRSLTCPNIPRFSSNAPLNRLDPMELPRDLPWSASKVKSASNGPKESFWPLPETSNVQVPVSKGNSKVKLRVSPGPKDEIPDCEETFLPSLVRTEISNPPRGIDASLVMSTVTKSTSSSSSSMSI